MDLLGSRGAVSISEMAGTLGASMMTIRRDIDSLEKEGLVRKMHGSAVLVGSDSSQPSYHERVAECQEEKDRIGKAAAAMIWKGSIVIFDAGTTPQAVVQHIPQDLEFTAITTGLMTATALCSRTNANVICIGGNIHQSSYSAINYFATEMIARFHADLAFISTKSVSLPDGLFEMQLPLIEIKRAISAVSDKVVLLADHRKFSSKALCLSVPIKEIDLIITDGQVPEDAQALLDSLNIEYKLV